MEIAPVKEGEGRPPVCNAAVAFRAVCGERARAMGSAQRVNHRAAERALLQNHNSANGGTERRAHLVLQLARMLARFQHQLRRTQNRLRGNLLGLRAIKPFGHAGVAAFAYYQRK